MDGFHKGISAFATEGSQFFFDYANNISLLEKLKNWNLCTFAGYKRTIKMNQIFIFLNVIRFPCS